MATTKTPTNLPFHPTSSNYTQAQAAQASQASQSSKPITEVKIPDGRRNSQGELVASPAETWKPRLNRRMSWNMEDLKRNAYKVEMLEREESFGEGVGFTEAEIELKNAQRKA